MGSEDFDVNKYRKNKNIEQIFANASGAIRVNLPPVVDLYHFFGPFGGPFGGLALFRCPLLHHDERVDNWVWRYGKGNCV